MTERKVTEKKVAAKSTAKKTTRRTATKKVASTFMIDAMSVGFKAGDVYQTLKDAENALSVEEIAKAANITTEETLLGMGWLLKEGKIKGEDNKFLLA
nr:winged helix-turn-helix domain-containing protein [uncultured Prevotella sp.]